MATETRIEAARAAGLSITYARVGERLGSTAPTRTPSGQVGVAFTPHRRLAYEVDGRGFRVDAPAGVTYLTSEGPIDWVEVHGPTEAIEIHIDPLILEAAGAHRAPSSFGVHDAVVLAGAARLRAAHVAGGGVTDLLASSVAHQLAAHIGFRYAGVDAPDARAPQRPGARWRPFTAWFAIVSATP